jgi:hypothetical protein
MPPRMFSVEGVMGLRSWRRYADGTANLRVVVAASSSIADGVASGGTRRESLGWVRGRKPHFSQSTREMGHPAVLVTPAK